MFCGDTLFAAGCGRVRNGQYAEMFRSLSLIKQFPAETKIYCSHEYTQANLLFAATVEPNNVDIQRRIIKTDALRSNNQPLLPALLSEELLTNPFLRTNNPQVKKMAEHHVGHFLDNEEAIFIALRDWKDSF